MKNKIIAALFLLATLLSACSIDTLDDQELITLKVTVSSRMSHATIFIAEAEGYFAEYGLKMEFINIGENASKAIPLLVSGDVDVYSGTLNSGFLNTVSMDDNIKAVAERGHTALGECTYQAILIRRDLYESGKVTEPADLKGLTISSNPEGPGGYLLSTYLSQGGLTFEDIKMVNLDTQSEIAAYSNQALDGNTAAEPEITVLLKSGEAVMLAKAEDVVGNYQSGVIAFNKKLLVDNPDIGARFLAAYLKGVQKYNEGKTERNLQILSEATGQTVENLQEMCWPAINENGMIDFASVDSFQQWAIANDQMEKPVTEFQFSDPSLLTTAQELLKQ